MRKLSWLVALTLFSGVSVAQELEVSPSFESPVEVASKLIISPFKNLLIGSSLRDVKKSFPDDFCENTFASIFPSMPSIPKIKILLIKVWIMFFPRVPKLCINPKIII